MIHSQSDLSKTLIHIILNDAILLRRLNDRVHEIFVSEMRQLRDRKTGGH